jgi:hypothetical protein
LNFLAKRRKEKKKKRRLKIFCDLYNSRYGLVVADLLFKRSMMNLARN